MGASGGLQEAVFVIDATVTGQSPVKVSVLWSDPLPQFKAPLEARIACSDAVRTIGWSLKFNNVPIGAGSGSVIPVNVVEPGIFRVTATVIDADGNTVVADSSITVQAPFGLQSAIVPAQPTQTLYLIGDVFSPLIRGDAVQCSYLPYELVSLTHVTKLLPGTTHYVIDLDPVNSAVDDEVVVRTAHGNWTLRGPPTGLSAEALPYDYQHGQPAQPAPLDLSVRYTAEALNVHGSVAQAHSFRVRIRCYRAGASLFRYTPCDWSAYYGGEGERQRRVIALITSVDVMLDAEWPDARWGSRGLEPFNVPDQRVVIGQFTTSGQPDRAGFAEDHFFTDQNAIARYESSQGQLRDLTVNCAYGLPGVRPCYLDFSQPAKPRIVQRLKRLYGQLVLYVAGGAFSPGTTITVRIYTGKSPGYIDVSVPVTAGVYNPDYTRYSRVASATIDIEDFEFDRVGVLMDFTVNQTAAGTGTPSHFPRHQVAEDVYFTGVNSPAIQVDTACFRTPVPVSVFEGTFAGSAVPLPSCNQLNCGPVGIYCYQDLHGTEVPPENEPPTASYQSVSLDENTSLPITLTGSDDVTPSGSLIFSVTVPPVHGDLTGTAPDLTYTPDPDYFGSDSFQFTVTDGGSPPLTSTAATISITVNEVVVPPDNNPPVATPQSVATDESVALPITLAGTDDVTPSGSLVFNVTVTPIHGDLTGTAPNLTYTPDAGYEGSDSFQFTVTDGGSPPLTSAAATISITVNQVNTAPTATPQSVAVTQDTPKSITLAGTDEETPGSLSFIVTVDPVNGVLTGTPPNLTYTPTSGYTGSDSFQFTVTDASAPPLTSSAATVSITVNPALGEGVWLVFDSNWALVKGVEDSPSDILDQARVDFWKTLVANELAAAGFAPSTAIAGPLWNNYIDQNNWFLFEEKYQTGDSSTAAVPGQSLTSMPGAWFLGYAYKNLSLEQVTDLAFVSQPTDVAVNASIAPDITVQAMMDLNPAPFIPVTLILVGTGALVGTYLATQLTDETGLATFKGLKVNTAGSKTLQASSESVTANSASFTVT